MQSVEETLSCVCCVWAQTIQHSIFESVNNVVRRLFFVGAWQTSQATIVIVGVEFTNPYIWCLLDIDQPRMVDGLTIN